MPAAPREPGAALHQRGAMLDHLVSWAVENPVLTKLDLSVREDNAGGISLYRDRGFVEEGVMADEVRLGDRRIALVGMSYDASEASS